ncbi:hypothetical protein N869_12225 [Cellulomonas bogoriensis 69B4 = DSM 16987]|uniref:Uncharacterized protein n=1 Tax=Cellulomonas bogoriensis 69B4 = DSM 16987 TaxID=1386082 RepID=A0A0A0BMM7_9CELL|nr:hypothetical protein N869_12225 [Cellulomonas bogoriensis 69B4 = DSM 16987]
MVGRHGSQVHQHRVGRARELLRLARCRGHHRRRTPGEEHVRDDGHGDLVGEALDQRAPLTQRVQGDGARAKQRPRVDRCRRCGRFHHDIPPPVRARRVRRVWSQARSVAPNRRPASSTAA